MSSLFSTVGLVLDIVGAILLFKFGLPPDFDPLGRDFIMTSTENTEERAKGRRYRFWGQIGLICLVLGFAGQLLGVWTR